MPLSLTSRWFPLLLTDHYSKIYMSLIKKTYSHIKVNFSSLTNSLETFRMSLSHAQLAMSLYLPRMQKSLNPFSLLTEDKTGSSQSVLIGYFISVFVVNHYFTDK